MEQRSCYRLGSLTLSTGFFVKLSRSLGIEKACTDAASKCPRGGHKRA